MFVFLFLNFPYIINVHTSFKLNIFLFYLIYFRILCLPCVPTGLNINSLDSGKICFLHSSSNAEEKYICHTWVVLPTFCHCQNAQTVLKYDKWIFSDIKLLKIFFFYSFYSFQATNQNCIISWVKRIILGYIHIYL